MFFLLYNWISGICRQKRILIILCTFSSSFMLFNYSLLSPTQSSQSSIATTTTHQSQDLFSNKNHFVSNTKVKEPARKQRHMQSMRTSFKKRFRISNENMEMEESQTRRKINPKILASQELWRMPETKDKIGFSALHRLSKKGERKRHVIFISAIENSSNRPNNEVFNDSNKNSGYASDKKTDYEKTTAITSPTIPLIFGESISESNIANNIASNISTQVIISPTSISPLIKSSISPSQTKLFYSEPLTTSSALLKSGIHNHNTTNKYSTTNINNQAGLKSSNTTSNNIIASTSFRIPSCHTPTQLRRVQKRKKNLTVIENFIMSYKRVRCNESVTYTTHGDYRYLDNLVPLVERWDGPISLSIYAPGKDLDKTLEMISYLKECGSPKIDEWVNFHLIYDVKYVNKPVQEDDKHGDLTWLDKLYKSVKWTDCSKKQNFSKFEHTFRTENGLLYPINIARNIARSAATTYFVLASDIELYPSINLIPSFMKMLKRLQKNEEEDNNRVPNALTFATQAIQKLFPGMNTTAISDIDNNYNEGHKPLNIQRQGQQHQGLPLHQYKRRQVYVLPVFEVKKDVLPCQVETKGQLLSLLRRREAVIFHHSICPQCHTFPKFEEWKSGINSEITKKAVKCANETDKRGKSIPREKIFCKAKRKFPYQMWEPIFIGTKEEPIYDERLSWEGLRDKMVSGYVMCAMDYDFFILENAFLVHKPGIRRVVHLVTKTVQSQDRLINIRIRSEMLRKYGRHDECAL